MNNLTSTEAPGESGFESLSPTLDCLGRLTAMPEALRIALASKARLVVYGPGEVLFRENAAAQDLLLILTGSVALEMNVSGRGKVRLISLGPGDWAGWSALMGGGQMTTSAVAQSTAHVAKFSADELRQMCDQNPDIGYPLMKCVAHSLANRLVATRLQLLDLFSSPTTDVTLAERTK